MHIVEMKSLVTKLLGPPEEIGMYGRPSNHDRRWMIFGNQRFKVYLHHSPHDASGLDLGPYPERLISIGFAKSYTGISTDALHAGDREAWILLLARSDHGPENIPHS